MSIIGAPLEGRIVTIYLKDEALPVHIDRVKATFWTAGDTVLTISRYVAAGSAEHYYIHWPREQFAWFKDEPERSKP